MMSEAIALVAWISSLDLVLLLVFGLPGLQPDVADLEARLLVMGLLENRDGTFVAVFGRLVLLNSVLENSITTGFCFGKASAGTAAAASFVGAFASAASAVDAVSAAGSAFAASVGALKVARNAAT